MTPEQALSQIEIAYAALSSLQTADWLHQVHPKTITDLADAIHYTNEVWSRLEAFHSLAEPPESNILLDKPFDELTKDDWRNLNQLLTW